jgi:lipoyl-dependent peroxiredoxin subunit D
MSNIEAVRSAIPDAAKDIRLNLSSVLQSTTLTNEQRWGVAIASALASRNRRLSHAVLADAKHQKLNPGVIEDAIAAASLMAMNNVYYRFRHMVGKEAYTTKPARLRMNRLAQPATNKLDFELFSLAVSAINACETCIQSHERVVVEGGLSEDAVHDAVRIAATMHAAATALEAAEVVVEANNLEDMEAAETAPAQA